MKLKKKNCDLNPPGANARPGVKESGGTFFYCGHATVVCVAVICASADPLARTNDQHKPWPTKRSVIKRGREFSLP